MHCNDQRLQISLITNNLMIFYKVIKLRHPVTFFCLFHVAENVFMRREYQQLRACLGDFGKAKMCDCSVSPGCNECIFHKGRAHDIYAIGALLFKLTFVPNEPIEMKLEERLNWVSCLDGVGNRRGSGEGEEGR